MGVLASILVRLRKCVFCVIICMILVMDCKDTRSLLQILAVELHQLEQGMIISYVTDLMATVVTTAARFRSSSSSFGNLSWFISASLYTYLSATSNGYS